MPAKLFISFYVGKNIIIFIDLAPICLFVRKLWVPKKTKQSIEKQVQIAWQIGFFAVSMYRKAFEK